MGKERIFELTNKKKARTSGLIHIGEIIPGVLKDIERKIKENTKEENVNNRNISNAYIPNLRVPGRRIDLEPVKKNLQVKE